MIIYFKKCLKSVSFFIILGIGVSACSTNDDPEPEIKNYRLLYSLPVDYIRSMMDSVVPAEFSAQIQYSVDVYSYNYPMEYQGKTITASGLVSVPVSNGKSFPVLSFQHGTMAAKYEAPSISYSYMSVAALAGMGYVTAIPDLVGFGASASYFHPFLIKKSNVDAVAAMLTSLSSLPDGVLSGSIPNDSLFLAGYSQGGWITLATMDYFENTSSEGWNLIGTACGAGPYNPEQLMQYVLKQETYPKPFFLGYVLLSFVEDGTITQDMDSYFNPPYASKMQTLFNGSLNGAAIDAELTTSTHDLLKAGFFNYQQGSEYDDLKSSFDKNKVTAWQTNSPLLLLHGENDTYIPSQLSDSIYSQFVALGSNLVQYETIPFTDHNSASVPSIIRSFEWFQLLRHKQGISLATKK